MSHGNNRILEEYDIVQAIAPVDLSSAANTGDWINMKDIERLLIVVVSAVGTAGDDPIVSLDQATANDGTGAKALSSIDKLWHKTGATALSAVANFSEVTQTASDSYDTDPIAGAENQQILCLEVLPTDLDMANDYTHVQLTVADVGTNAMLGCALYFARRKTHQAPTLGESLIA